MWEFFASWKNSLYKRNFKIMLPFHEAETCAGPFVHFRPEKKKKEPLHALLCYCIFFWNALLFGYSENAEILSALDPFEMILSLSVYRVKID